MSPPKEKPLLGGEGLRKLTKTGYGPPPVMQVWAREAARLLAAFLNTGNPRHLRAFFTQVAAILVHETTRAFLDFVRPPTLTAFCRPFHPTLSRERPALKLERR
jgi:hypothetical protein